MLARRQVVAAAADGRAAGGAELAQQRGGAIGVAARAEAVEGVAGAARGGDRERGAGAGLDAREREPRAGLLQRVAQRAEACDGVRELACGLRGVAAGRRDAAREQRRLGDQVLAARAAQPLGGSARGVELAAPPARRRRAARARARPRRRARSSRARACARSPRSRCSRTSARERRGLVVEAGEQPRGLLAAALAQAQLGEHRERQRAAAAPASVGLASQRGGEHRLGALPVAGADEDARRRWRGTTTGRA